MDGNNLIAKRAIIGLALAFVALFIGFMAAGAGHGWGAPFFVSFALFLIYPVVLTRALAPARNRLLVDLGLVALAVVLNVFLVLDLIDRADGVRWRANESIVPGIHQTIFPFFLVWLVIWFWWQFVAIRTVWRDLASQPAA